MDSFGDQQLLSDYVATRSELAFAELVRRHIDFVYSAAFRIIRDAHLAEDVTQGVFTALAQRAGQLVSHPVLSGWLHRTTRNIAAQIIRTDTRRRAREQEAAAMNEPSAAVSDTVWEQIAPHLDAALGELNEPDRDALLLRFFERKSARDMAELLKISDEAAQKRVARAVERLREFLAKRGVTVGAGGLTVAVSANAVQAAPAGLAIAVSSAAVLGTTAAITAVATHTTMNWITTKTLGAMAAAAVIAGTGTYFVQRENNDLLAHKQLRTLTAKNIVAPTLEITPANGESDRQKKDQSELRRLRGEVGQLRQQLELAQAQTPPKTHAAPTVPIAAVHEPGSYIRGDQLIHAGFATPEAAWESVAWARFHGTYDQVIEGLSPVLRAVVLKDPRGPDELAAGQAHAAATFKGMQIMAKKVVTENRVELKVKTEWATTSYSIQVMGRFDGEWKAGGSIQYSGNSWDNDGQVQTYALQ